MDVNTLISEIEAQIAVHKCGNCSNNGKCSANCCKNCLKYGKGNFPDYSKCENLRWHYILRYFWAHFREVNNLLSRIPRRVRERMKGQSFFKIDSIGGGPGVDLLSTIAWLQNTFDVEQSSIQGFRIDRVKDWIEQSKMIFQLHGQGSLKRTAKTMDAFEYRPDSDTHIICISYLLSELIKQQGKENTTNWLREICSKASSGTLLLVNDRPEQVIKNILSDSIAEDHILFAHRDGLIRGNLSEDGFIVHEQCHIGDSIPDDKRNYYQSKLFCTSVQLAAFF